MASVLTIDDDAEIGSMLTDLVTSVDHEAEYVTTLEEGLERINKGSFDVVFLDVCMPGGSGLDIMEDIFDVEIPPEIIVITGKGDSTDAETAIKRGAWDYIQKPLSPKKIIQPLNRILQYRDGIRAISKPDTDLIRGDILGNSGSITECLNKMAKAAQTSSNVLITGETGTGKELFARAIHENSARRDKKFVIIDCAALPETLAESALFGHEKGSFTGADRTTKGLVSLAHGGTLFLDEVGEMSASLQKVFLRVLQERKFRPVGSKIELQSDFRLIAATNRKPETMVSEIGYRADLLYRLNAIPIKLPPLRNRIEDLEDLVIHYMEKVCDTHGCKKKSYSREFINTLKHYSWPGNVRELVNTLQASVTEAFYEPILFPKHLPEAIRIMAVTSGMQRSSGVPVAQSVEPVNALQNQSAAIFVDTNNGLPTFKECRNEALREVETQYLKKLMRETRGNIKKACVISGLGRTRLYTLLKGNNVDRMGWE